MTHPNLMKAELGEMLGPDSAISKMSGAANQYNQQQELNVLNKAEDTDTNAPPEIAPEPEVPAIQPAEPGTFGDKDVWDMAAGGASQADMLARFGQEEVAKLTNEQQRLRDKQSNIFHTAASAFIPGLNKENTTGMGIIDGYFDEDTEAPVDPEAAQQTQEIQQLADFNRSMGIQPEQEKGAVETTSPFEFFGTGALVAGKIAAKGAGKLLGKEAIDQVKRGRVTTAVKWSAVASGPESLVQVGVDELAEGNMFVGMLAEMTFGVVNGMAIEKLARSMGDIVGSVVTKKIGSGKLPEHVPDPELEAGIALARQFGISKADTRAIIKQARKDKGGPLKEVPMELIERYADQRDLAKFRAENKGKSEAFILNNNANHVREQGKTNKFLREEKARTGEDVASSIADDGTKIIDSAWIKAHNESVDTLSTPQEPKTATNLHSKIVAKETTKLNAKLAKGDLRDPETREVLLEAVKEAQGGDISSEVSGKMTALKSKIELAEKQSLVAKKAPDMAAFSAGGGTRSKRIEPAVKAAVIEEWYGKVHPAFNEKKAIKAEADLLVKNGVDKSKAQDMAQRKIRSEMRDGMHGELFLDDVRTNFTDDLAAWKRANTGMKPNILEIAATSRARTIQEYSEYSDEAIKEMAAKVDPARSFSPTKDKFVRGDTVEIGNGSMHTPEGGIEYASGEYKVRDWNYYDHLEFVPDKNNLVMLPESPMVPKKVKTLGPKQAAKYESMATAADLNDYVKRIVARWEGWGEYVQKPGSKYKTLEKAEALKVDTVIPKKGGGHQTIKALPDREVDAVARLYGWNENLVQPKHSVADDGTLYQTSIDDILDAHNKYITSDPGYMNSMMKSSTDRAVAKEASDVPGKSAGQDAVNEQAGSADSSYRKISGGHQEYRAQREAFLRQAMGTPKMKGDAYFRTVDRVAVMRNHVIGEIKITDGTEYETQAKELYVMLGDQLAGTNRYAQMRDVNNVKARNLAMIEHDAYMSGRDKVVSEELFEDRVFKYADAHSMNPKAAREELIAMDEASPSVERGAGHQATTGRVDSADYVDSMKASEKAGTSVQALEQPQVSSFRNINEVDEFLLGKQVNKIEQHFGVKWGDELYSPGFLGGSGKLNVFKLNTVDDITQAMKLPKKDLLEMPYSSSKNVLNIQAFEGHNEETETILTNLITDTVGQMDELAGSLRTNPDDILGAVAWEKLRSINEMMMSTLTKGAPSEDSLEAFSKMNLLAREDAGILERLSKVVDDNYYLYSSSGADTRWSVDMASRVSQIPSLKGKADFLNKVSERGTYLGTAKNRTDTINARRNAELKLKEACNA